MLYANETIQPWDVNGQDFIEEQRKKEELEREMIIQQGKACQSLKENAGWKLVEKFLEECIEAYGEKMLIARDIEDIRRLQETVNAYRTVLSFVEWKINEATSFINPRTPDIQG